MKRPTKKQPNIGPKKPRNRKEQAEKAQTFISQCETSLIKILGQRAREKDCKTWLDLEKELQERHRLLLKTYPNHKGKIATAVRNVGLALKKVKENELRQKQKVSIVL